MTRVLTIDEDMQKPVAYCCQMMQVHIEYRCDQHPNPCDCPDNLVAYSSKFDEYGIIIHDGGASVVLIAFCPWCGAKLPESKRDRWFEELRASGFDDPVLDLDIPDEYQSNAWYSQKD